MYQSLTLAFAMYSKIPMPSVEWDDDSMKWVFCFFPLVGVVIGAALYLWLHLALALALGGSLTAVGALIIPLALSGGIHLDGLCDTCDALGSHQSRERKLEILKDSRIGAFGVMGCTIYLVALYAGWCSIAGNEGELRTLCLVPVLSRACSALMAVSCRNARGSGMLFTFTGKNAKGLNRIISGIWAILSAFGMIFWGGISGTAAVAIVILCTVYYLYMSKTQFGGITGDLEGWYLQMLELLALLTVAFVGKVVL